MANLFAGHKNEWKALADIDYFGNFVKAYIPFNAWMNTSYPSLSRDRDKIDEIKKNPNPLRDKICVLLDAEQDGIQFRNLLGELHSLLENHYIYNKDKRISFSGVTIDKNPEKQSIEHKRGIEFIANRDKKVISLIKNRKKEEIFKLEQENYDINGLQTNQVFQKLSTEYQSYLLGCYKDIEPYIQKDFTDIKGVDEKYNCGAYKFVKDHDHDLAKGLIEILYNLRCSLFHGELVPNKEANQIYGTAYRILYMLIQSL